MGEIDLRIRAAEAAKELASRASAWAATGRTEIIWAGWLGIFILQSESITLIVIYRLGMHSYAVEITLRVVNWFLHIWGLYNHCSFHANNALSVIKPILDCIDFSLNYCILLDIKYHRISSFLYSIIRVPTHVKSPVPHCLPNSIQSAGSAGVFLLYL